ncbi:hypothetical protein Tco_0169891 [Tanacetum coccineum]
MARKRPPRIHSNLGRSGIQIYQSVLPPSKTPNLRNDDHQISAKGSLESVLGSLVSFIELRSRFGNFLEKLPRECLKIIESNSSSSFKTRAKAVCCQDKKNQASCSIFQLPAPVKAVELKLCFMVCICNPPSTQGQGTLTGNTVTNPRRRLKGGLRRYSGQAYTHMTADKIDVHGYGLCEEYSQGRNRDDSKLVWLPDASVHWDYRKVKRSHPQRPLPLPSWTMLMRLAGNEYYCFLMVSSGYFQIPIDPVDQEKTTFYLLTERLPSVACLSAYAMLQARFTLYVSNFLGHGLRMKRWTSLWTDFFASLPHGSHRGNHGAITSQAKKIFDSGFFWPTSIKMPTSLSREMWTRANVKEKTSSKRDEMPQNSIQVCMKSLTLWGHRLYGPFPSSTREQVYSRGSRLIWSKGWKQKHSPPTDARGHENMGSYYPISPRLSPIKLVGSGSINVALKGILERSIACVWKGAPSSIELEGTKTTGPS